MRYLLVVTLVGALSTCGCTNVDQRADKSKSPSANTLATKDKVKSDTFPKQESLPNDKPEKGNDTANTKNPGETKDIPNADVSPGGSTPKQESLPNDKPTKGNDTANTKNPGKKKAPPNGDVSAGGSTTKQESLPKDEPAKGTANPDTTQVIAEGVGATGDEALKDAFRNAVRQVVGTVVDAETLVKNDEILSDKVLTYSDGFVKTYEEISKKQDKGLCRTKIKAIVERRSVIARLKAANITVKDVDGKGLFAEVVTKVEAEKNAAVLVQTTLDGYPANVIRAEVVGKPRVKRSSDTEALLEYDVKISVDLAEYETFTKRLVPLLDKVALQKGEINAKADDQWARMHATDTRQKESFLGTAFGYENPGNWPKMKFSDGNAITNTALSLGFDRSAWWKGGQDRSSHIAVVVNTGRSGLDDRTKWNWYCIPRSWFRIPKRITIAISFIDKEARELTSNQLVFERRVGPGLAVSWPDGELNAIVSPYFFEGNAFYWRNVTVTQEIRFTVEEVQKFDTIRCSVSVTK